MADKGGLIYKKPEFPADAFEGTSDYYQYFRIPYPQILIEKLFELVKPVQRDLLIDLACGPGRLTFPLADKFNRIIAVDREAGMIKTGMKTSEEANVQNIKWFTGDAEDLDIDEGTADLVTVGDAFDRLDQGMILEKSYNWLKPGGCFAIVGMYAIWRGEEKWHSVVNESVQKWSTLSPILSVTEFRNYSHLLEGKNFKDVVSEQFEFLNTHTLDSIIGYLYSTSRCSKKVLGNNADEFEAELRTKLSGINSSGIFEEKVKCGFTLGRKTFS